MPSVTIPFEHTRGNYPYPDDDPTTCEDEITVDLEYEPADRNYGADADGNRGMYVAGYYYPASDAPEKCPECGHIYDHEERSAIEKLLEQAADSYFDDPPDDYDDPPDYYPDEPYY